SDGMETLLLLACPEPLGASDAELRRRFAGLGAQRPIQNRFAAVWFENGRVVEEDDRRRRTHFGVGGISDPVLRGQELLGDRLGPLAPFTSAVSFARVRR